MRHRRPSRILVQNGRPDMSLSDPLEILLAHNHWATRELLAACTKLTGEQFHRRFNIGPGSLHDTTTHVIGGMRGWGDMLAGRPEGARLLDGTRRTPQELLALLEESAADLAASARAHAAEEIVTGPRGTFPRGGVLTHVTTHGMHHRAQCLNMLRQ